MLSQGHMEEPSYHGGGGGRGVLASKRAVLGFLSLLGCHVLLKTTPGRSSFGKNHGELGLRIVTSIPQLHSKSTDIHRA